MNKTEASGDTLAEARDKVTILMNKNKERRFDFDARLQDAITEVWNRNQEAREKIEEAKEMATDELTAIRDSLICGYR